MVICPGCGECGEVNGALLENGTVYVCRRPRSSGCNPFCNRADGLAGVRNERIQLGTRNGDYPRP